MYEAFYGLREKPFSILPDPDLIYWCKSHRLALAMLEFGVMNSAGFTVITGEIGCGLVTSEPAQATNAATASAADSCFRRMVEITLERSSHWPGM